MLEKLNVPAKRPTAAMVGAGCGDRKKEWESYSGETFHMSHSRAGVIAYKKAPAGTTVEVANGTILLVDRFGTIEVDLDQPGTTTKPVKMVAVVYVPVHSRNLLSTRKALEQWGKPLVYYKTKAVLRFPGEKTLIFNLCLRKELLSAKSMRRITGQGIALAVAAKARDIMEVHRIHTHPSKGITRKTAEAIRVKTTGQWGARADVRQSSSRWRWQQKRLRR